MPDSRFEAAYERAENARNERSAGLRGISRDDLVAALAIAGSRDAVFANALATELLNRLRRAPYRGVAISCAVAGALIILTNWLDLGTFLPLETGLRAGILNALAGAFAAVAALAWAVSRGAFPAMHARLGARKRSW